MLTQAHGFVQTAVSIRCTAPQSFRQESPAGGESLVGLRRRRGWRNQEVCETPAILRTVACKTSVRGRKKLSFPQPELVSISQTARCAREGEEKKKKGGKGGR